MKIGFGYDVHRLVEQRRLVLGGVEIPYEKGLLGHSDADVLIHSICDALLGAMALGDIGRHFADSDPSFKDIDSRILLRKCYAMVLQRNYVLSNLDATICAAAPKLAGYIDAMRANLAEDFACDLDRISIKATTEEGLGVSGCAEGMSATSVILIMPEALL
ncbi:MAG: 2-C-methyl-D-erythritol 2,4-cyclodiphosphate synthase [Candidatus Cloacimonetes bacterium]|jgi:2-C-methyl-D-erythritol 2,4-cyclodiphosphate synthase|nr:2-C-methyl-D-erythritol 2,4-cyclodiphosphate synthase [Candidatus Cloacimonadota bacterium]MDY0336610.1 2-C-methyl-D-erythritol 2,4-cyclodiphosphate synthase [Candidatus Cloacimonadaceae bacterium]MDD3096460.1 2-C-methyl-D-erythritol 2,4-cyclodiphosphate synthase [Candidatus Cloacimonadota bacterium]MDD4035168.1 2-C-methyl-D-erythritol 2,4-cyclodiphosphate synthase [Candidatus Cloacimonadota bacterium]MDD4666898.1 2-C-methyl-D-erythritol 2,4-cyclodiphosphate synthase [Candidatus Cloacimonado